MLDEYVLALPKECGGYLEVRAVWSADVHSCYRGVCCESVVICSVVKTRAKFLSALGERFRKVVDNGMEPARTGSSTNLERFTYYLLSPIAAANHGNAHSITSGWSYA